MFCKHISSNDLSAPADAHMMKILYPVWQYWMMEA